MKHEAEQALLKTLNGQLSQLPAVAKEMVQQYQLSAIVLSVLCGLLFIAVMVGTIWGAIKCFKKEEAKGNEWHVNDVDYGFIGGMIVMFGGATSIAMLTGLVVNIIHACAPIASLVSEFIN